MLKTNSQSVSRTPRYLYSILPLEPPLQAHPTREEIINQYLVKANIPKLLPELTEILDKPISVEEAETVLKAVKPGKSTGTDGLISQYYKLFVHKLLPELTAACNSIHMGSSFMNQPLQAHISVIHKEGKDPALCPRCREGV